MFKKSPTSRRKDELNNRINILPTSSTKCFICDEHIQRKSVPLVMCRTQYSNATYPSKIGELVGDEFMVVVCMEDVLCGKCTNLLNRLDKLEMDLKVVRRTLTGYLAAKYNINHKDLFSKFEKGGISEKRNSTEAAKAPKVHRCEICDFSSTDKKKVDVHSKECPALPHACALCPKRFPSIQGHAEHAVLVHKLTSACQICSSLFVSQQQVADHMKTHPSCSVCKTVFADEAQLTEHIAHCHKPEPPVIKELTKDQDSSPLDSAEIEFHTCAICALTFLKASLFNEHMKMHENQGSSQNESPTTNLADVSRIEDDLEDLFEKLHAETDDSSKAATIGTPSVSNEETSNGSNSTCCFCPTRLASKQELELHLRVHADGSTCAVCKQVVSAGNVLQHCRQHLSESTNSRQETSTQGGGERVPAEPAVLPPREDSQSQHKGGKKFQCDECPRFFVTRTGLDHHRAVHTGNFKFCCDFCGKGFMARARLQEHQRSHTKEDRYVCDICGRKFSFQSTYWIHRKWHENPYPYRCNVCGKLFRHTSLLAVHKRKHSGERPYKCPHCPVTFSVGTSLKRHVILHTGAYPHKCQDCNKGFTAKDTYRLHRSKVHGDVEKVDSKTASKDFLMAVHDSEAGDEPAPTATAVGHSWEILDSMNLEQVLGESNKCAAQQTESLVVDATTLTLSGVEGLGSGSGSHFVQIISDDATTVTVANVEYSAKPWLN